MSTVPETNDAIDASSSIENTKPAVEPEINIEGVVSSSSPTSTPAPAPTPSVPISVTENEDKASVKAELPSQPPPPPPPTAKQHLSRLSLFHRNTIHVCDQIVDRV